MAAEVIGQLVNRETNNREDAGVNASGIEGVMAAILVETLHLHNTSKSAPGSVGPEAVALSIF